MIKGITLHSNLYSLNELTNDNIDYYMGIPPRRQEDETYDEMKNRGKLAKALLKYRAQLYDYSVYEKQ